MTFYPKMAQEALSGHDFRQAKEPALIPHCKRLSGVAGALAPSVAAHRQRKPRSLLPAGAQYLQVVYIFPGYPFYHPPGELSTYMYSIIQNIAKMWWYLPAIEVVA